MWKVIDRGGGGNNESDGGVDGSREGVGFVGSFFLFAGKEYCKEAILSQPRETTSLQPRAQSYIR